MNITPVSIKSDISPSPFRDNNAIKLLEKQKAQLQEQIQKTNESKMDNKVKQDKIKQLQDQIQQIDMEILQRRREKLTPKNNRQAVDNQSGANSPADHEDGHLAGMSDLIQASSAYSQAKVMNGTKNHLSGISRILKKEIELDEARSLSGNKAVSKRQELQKIESREQMLGKKVGEAVQITHDKVEEASREENENNEAGYKDKNKENSEQQALKWPDKIYKRVDVKI
jgi:DNA repair exonuclease SbcCD ATPase subunit